MGSGIPEELGLARIGFGREWLEVETTTANEFMSALALALCDPSSDLSRARTTWVPTTDDGDALRALLSGVEPMRPGYLGDRDLRLRVKGELCASHLRASFLEACLPVPVEPLDADSIVAFRRRHKDKLPRFRRHLERLIDRTLRIDDEVLQFRELERIAEETEELVVEVEAYLREAGIRKVRRSRLLRLLKFVPMLSTPIGATQEAAAALETVDEQVETEPLAYLAFARVELGLSDTYRGTESGGPALAEVFAR